MPGSCHGISGEEVVFCTVASGGYAHTEGTKMLSNFVYNVCGCKGDWKMDAFVESSIEAIREKVGSGRVLCALSGGVDSSVAAVMMAKAVGKQLTAYSLTTVF